jgi:O-antigen ligase
LPSLANPRASRVGLGPLVLAAALPLLFLHRQYQPSLTTGGVTLTLADLGLAAVVVVALAAGLREGFAPLARARFVWLALALFVVWMFASLTWARHDDAAYALGSHIVSAGKFLEFMLLAPAVPLILRRPAERRVFFVAFVAWSSFLTLVAILQFLGVVNEFEGRRSLQREPSYAGVHELGAISGAALSLAFVAIAIGRWRRSSLAPLLAGGLGVALAAALDSVGGIVAAAATVWAIARTRDAVPLRRVGALAATVVVVAVAAVSLRGTAVTAFLEFLGVRAPNENTQTHVQTYAHRTLLGYIGVKIWLDHPIVGAGWQESEQPAAFTPHLAAAHRRFPTEPEEAFPAPEHEWGVQNGIIQTLADLGVVGLVLLLAGLVASFLLALRAGALIAPAWLWVAFAVFTGTGLLAGASVNVLLWLAVGLAVSVDRVPR